MKWYRMFSVIYL